MTTATWILSGVLFAFLVLAFCFAPKKLSWHQRQILVFFLACFAGLFWAFLSGDVMLWFNWEPWPNAKLSVQAIGGGAFFVVVLIVFWRWNSSGSADNKTPLDKQMIGNLVDRLELANQEIGKGKELEQENTWLRRQLAGAIERADDAERHQLPVALGVIKELRKTADAGLLLKVLKGIPVPAGKAGLELHREIAATAYVKGDWDVALSALETIIKSEPNNLDALTRKGRILLERGDFDAAEKLYRRVVQLGTLKGDASWRAAGYGNLGTIYTMRADLNRAEKCFRESLQISRRVGNRLGIAGCLHELGIIAQARGLLIEAGQFYRDSLRIAEQLGDQFGIAQTYHQLGVVAQKRRNLEEAENCYRQSLRTYEALGNRPGMAGTYHQMARLAEQRGKFVEAENWVRESLNISKVLSNRSGIAASYYQLGMIAHKRGDLGEAQRWYRECMEIAEAVDTHGQARGT